MFRRNAHYVSNYSCLQEELYNMDEILTTVRATPKTSRGERRVKLILDAAADVIAEVGYEAATTNAIAQHAGTSIGSLYQFFPNKEKLAQALAERYRADLHALLDSAREQASGQLAFVAQLELLIDNVVAFAAANPAFETLFWQERPTAHHPSGLQNVISYDALASEILGRVHAIFDVWGASVPPVHRQLYAEVCMCTVQALLPSTHNGPLIRQELVDELKRLVANYLTPVFCAEESTL